MSSHKTPQVAIIGRPNVGKSTLFNILTRSRKSVVKNQPGVTRDIIVEPAEWWGSQFDVVDTGGVTDSEEGFSALIKEQVSSLVDTFDLLIVVMDGKSGLVPEDRDIVKMAKRSGKPWLLVVNKVDRQLESDVLTSEFYEFGVEVLGTSFEQRIRVDELIEWIKENLPSDEENTRREGIRLAIIGKPNVGKSSMCNFLLKKKRMLVSDIAGTTIDAVEEEFEYGDQKYILVDTAGLRRPSKREEGLEEISAIKSHKAINKADIVLLMVDACEGPSHQDCRMIEYILDQHKAVILVANKLDQVKEERPAARQWFLDRMAKEFHFIADLPIVFTSAKTGSGVQNLFSKVQEVWEKLHIKISTSKLNDFFYQVIRQAPSPVYGTQNVKFYYLTQTRQTPPSFLAFANYPKGVTPAYRRFLTKNIKKQWGLEGIPVRIFIMKSGK